MDLSKYLSNAAKYFNIRVFSALSQMFLTFLWLLLKGRFKWCHWIFYEGSLFFPLLPLQCWYWLKLQEYQIALCWEKGKTVLFLRLVTYMALPHSTGKKVSPQLAAKEEAVRSSFTSTGLKCGSTQRIQLSQDANSKNTCVNFSKRKSFSCLNR